VAEPGDVLLEVDGIDVSNQPLDVVYSVVRGEEVRNVQVQVQVFTQRPRKGRIKLTYMSSGNVIFWGDKIRSLLTTAAGICGACRFLMCVFTC
jgi:hypothetical protein